MKQWGLAMISVGGILIMASQLQTNSYPLIAAGLSFVVGGVIMYKKDKKDKT